MIHPHPAEWTYSVLIWAALLLAVQPLVILDYTWHILALLLVVSIKWLINDSIDTTGTNIGFPRLLRTSFHS